ncbi:hypothetical protein LINPERPRIM_LOCUS23657 [Linum perenne]
MDSKAALALLTSDFYASHQHGTETLISGSALPQLDIGG